MSSKITPAKVTKKETAVINKTAVNKTVTKVKAKSIKEAPAAELSGKDLSQVREHYEDYPYPLRNPEDEKQRLLMMQGEYLGELNHWLYEGKQDFNSGFRVLVAGGGTGDSVVFLAEQLKNTSAEIVYLDFSKASMEIAKARAVNRGLDNITWVYGSILEIPKLKLGKFDYINCCGVLHHLASPPEGLQMLRNSLTETGGMFIMVYAQIGRTGVYHVQDMMRMVNENVASTRAEEVANCRAFLNIMPETSWFARAKELIGDHINFGDIGIYDLFLHKQDRAYTIPQLYGFVEDAGLNLIEFVDPVSRISFKIENYIKDLALLEKIRAKGKVTVQAICELLVGNIIKHTIYVSAKKNPSAEFSDFDNVPYFYGVKNFSQQIHDHLPNNPIAGSALDFSFTSSTGVKLNVKLPTSHYSKYFFKHLMGEDKSFKEIFDAIREETGSSLSDAELSQDFLRTFSVMKDAGVLLLKHKSISVPFKI